jgi:hypothetical protein
MDTLVIPPAEPKATEIAAHKQTIHRNASWGAILSIVIILAMVIIGAFYAWGERITQYRAVQSATQNS